MQRHAGAGDAGGTRVRVGPEHYLVAVQEPPAAEVGAVGSGVGVGRGVSGEGGGGSAVMEEAPSLVGCSSVTTSRLSTCSCWCAGCWIDNYGSAASKLHVLSRLPRHSRRATPGRLPGSAPELLLARLLGRCTHKLDVDVGGDLHAGPGSAWPPLLAPAWWVGRRPAGGWVGCCWQPACRAPLGSTHRCRVRHTHFVAGAGLETLQAVPVVGGGWGRG